MALSNINFKEFRYNNSGEYHNQDPSNKIRFKKRINRDSGPGTICIACGIERSKTNKCECNS
jgi:hypothetical protein